MLTHEERRAIDWVCTTRSVVIGDCKRRGRLTADNSSLCTIQNQLNGLGSAKLGSVGRWDTGESRFMLVYK